MADQDTEQPSAQQEVGEPQVDTPPYDDLRGSPSAEGAEAVSKAYDASNAGAPGPGAETSDEERKGMSSTEMNPEPPLGVGKSTSSSAEDQAPDRPDVHTTGAGRPAGKADPDDSGVNPNPAVTEGSPNLQPGDG